MTSNRSGAIEMRPLTRRTALFAGGAGLAAALTDTSTGVLAARQATPEAVATQEFPAEDLLAFESIIDTNLGATATPGALVGIRHLVSRSRDLAARCRHQRCPHRPADERR